MNKITLTYRNWLLEVTDPSTSSGQASATATLDDGSGERFECYRQASAEDALRMAKNKVNRLEGPENWNLAYEDEALR